MSAAFDLQPESGAQLYSLIRGQGQQGAQTPAKRLKTNCESVDAALAGGIPYGSVTGAIVDGVGIGAVIAYSIIASHLIKTTYPESQTSGGEIGRCTGTKAQSESPQVAYIDTLGSFSGQHLLKALEERLVDLDAAHLPAGVASSSNPEAPAATDIRQEAVQLLDKVQYMRTFDFHGIVEAVTEVSGGIGEGINTTQRDEVQDNELIYQTPREFDDEEDAHKSQVEIAVEALAESLSVMGTGISGSQGQGHSTFDQEAHENPHDREEMEESDLAEPGVDSESASDDLHMATAPETGFIDTASPHNESIKMTQEDPFVPDSQANSDEEILWPLPPMPWHDHLKKKHQATETMVMDEDEKLSVKSPGSLGTNERRGESVIRDASPSRSIPNPEVDVGIGNVTEPKEEPKPDLLGVPAYDQSVGLLIIDNLSQPVEELLGMSEVAGHSVLTSFSKSLKALARSRRMAILLLTTPAFFQRERDEEMGAYVKIESIFERIKPVHGFPTTISYCVDLCFMVNMFPRDYEKGFYKRRRSREGEVYVLEVTSHRGGSCEGAWAPVVAKDGRLLADAFSLDLEITEALDFLLTENERMGKGQFGRWSRD